jgi:hypothetical protein
VKFPFVFKQKEGGSLIFYMNEETQNTLPELTDVDEVRKAIIASEILNRKY